MKTQPTPEDWRKVFRNSLMTMPDRKEVQHVLTAKDITEPEHLGGYKRVALTPCAMAKLMHLMELPPLFPVACPD